MRRRAWSARNVLEAKFKGLQFEGEWKDFIGTPELAKSWIIWGQSGSGKTTFNFQLANYLSNFERVLYNSLEEGLSMSIQETYKRVGIADGNRVILVNESMAQLAERLRKHKSPNVVFIDSVRYARMNWNQYQAFCNEFSNKILIWVSHAKGKEPKGALAEDIRFDSPVKLYTEGFRVFCTSRYRTGGESTYDIWPEGAANYWGEIE